MFQIYEQEAKNTKINIQEVTHFLNEGKEQYQEIKRKLLAYENSNIVWDPNLFNEGRVEWLKQSLIETPKLVNAINPYDPDTVATGMMRLQFELTGSIHITMFIISVDLLGTETQRKDFLEKCYKYEIVGCYAQTEIGHGSDVQSLQTTATFDKQTNQFVINTPSIEAAKYWPGDMALHANWALVHARCIIEGNDFGIQNFLVPIRDENHKLLPGIEAGDIGPKWGFFAKDNGYMILKNVRIPKKNMLRRYVKIDNGALIKKGNPKVGYATMMVVRRLLSGHATKMYSQSICIAGKYAFARKQFKNDKKEEITIINYQLQQNKLISCMAEHFAIQVGGRTVSRMTTENIEMVNKEDFSLMKQTHNCLCLTKALYSELCLRGMETCRLACGGHGFSHYSRLPHIIQQFSPIVTLEGENTVLYLQLARYVMKAYSRSLTKKKPLGPSVKYIENANELLETKCAVQNVEGWNLEAVKTLLAQSVISLILSASEIMMSEQDQKAAWNFKAGIRLQQVAYSHAIYWTYTVFLDSINNFTATQQSKNVISELCLLFGINSLLAKPQSLIESKLILGNQLTSLQDKKEILLKSLRTNFAALIQSLDLPFDYQDSALTHGNVYKNLFELAKKNSINRSISPAVQILKDGLTNTRPRM